MKIKTHKPYHSPTQIAWMLVGWVYVFAAFQMVVELVRIVAK